MKYRIISTALFFSLFVMHPRAQNFKNKLSTTSKTFTASSGESIQGEEGILKVPENRKKTNSENIDLKYVRLKSLSDSPKAPIIYLTGGPGSTSTGQAKNPNALSSWIPLLKISDVILLDQRGTGSYPNRLTWIWQGDFPEDFFVSEEKALNHYRKMSQMALAHYQNNGIDIAGYTTQQSAQDIDDLRKALDLDKISLMGFSYGTHLGLSYIKEYGEHIENAILIGVEGPNHTMKLPLTMDRQFQKIALLASKDESIRSHVPDLIALYQQVKKKLSINPAELELNHPLTRKKVKVKVGAFGLDGFLRADIGDASDIPVIPRLLFDINKGDYSSLKWFAQKRIVWALGVQGMSMMMDAASGVSPTRLAQINEENQKSIFSNVVNFPNLPTLDLWNMADLGDDFRSNPISKVRTLFLSGSLDFNTPPFQAEEIKWGFSNAYHIIVENAGHEQILPHKNIQQAILDFLNGKNVRGNTAVYQAIQFVPIGESSSKISHPSIR